MNIEVDSTVRCYSADEAVINSSMENIFKILADINKWPEWQSDVKKADIAGKPEAGKEFGWKAGGFKIKSCLHTVNPYSEIGWTGRMLWIKAVHNWYLFKENGNTKVIVKESLRGLGSSGMVKSLKEGMRKNLAELKNKAENS